MTHNLPVALTSFVGRGEELATVRQLVGKRRLVTLTGLGGSGKTRLAAEVAAEVAADFAGSRPDGVWWFDLGSVTDPEQVPRLLASTLGVLVEPDGDPIQTLASRLRQRQILLCLDTCEHLLDAAAALAEVLLRTCTGISVLATSREPLGISGETVWKVPPLKEVEAVRLFADRAALVSPEFAVDLHRADVEVICRRVDGLPLAIELAAAWVRALSPAQIGVGLDNSFRLLAGGPRGALPRHRALNASMEWSHDLLDRGEQLLFRRLAVFVGDFTLDAARMVCGDDDMRADEVLTVLGRLVDKSLVVVRQPQSESEARFRLLDTVRQYAEERLSAAGEVRAFRDRHLDYFLALAERAEPGLDRDQDTWRGVLDRHHDEIAAALHWSLSNASGQHRGRRLCAAMARQWFIRGQAREGIEFLERAVAVDEADRSVLQARLLVGLAMLGMVSGRRQLVADMASRAGNIAAEAGDDRIRARCLVLAAYPWFFVDFARCHDLATEAYALAEEVGEPFARDLGRMIAAYTMTTRDRHAEAVTLARAAFGHSMPRGDRFCAGFARGVELVAAMYTGDIRGALTLGDELLDIVAPLGEYFAVGTNMTNVALARGLAGDIAGGRGMLDTIVRSFDDAPDIDVVGLMITLGQLALWEGKLDDAVKWFERSTDPISATTDDEWTAVRGLPGLAGALRRLGRLDEAGERATRGIASARAFGAPYVLAAALDEQGLLVADTNPARALDLHYEALALRREHGLRTTLVSSLDVLAILAFRTDRLADSARMLAASDAARRDIGCPRPPIDQPAIEATVAALRAALGQEEFEGIWAAGQATTLDDAVTFASRGRGRRDRPATGWASLTPTEVEVVRLVADGLTNPEIARRLFISRATVKTHLSHIFAKLDVANRTELATQASDRLRGGDT